MEEFQDYCNTHRVHQSLNLKTPNEAAGKDPPGQGELINFVWHSHCQGLFQTPMAARFGIRHAQDRHRIDEDKKVVSRPVLNGLHHDYRMVSLAA